MTVKTLKELSFDRLNEQLTQAFLSISRMYIRTFKKKFFKGKYWVCSNSVGNSLYFFFVKYLIKLVEVTL